MTQEASHPGVFLQELMAANNILVARNLADELEVSRSALCRLLNGKSDLSPAMAYKLSLKFDVSFYQWMRWQAEYDFARIIREVAAK